ncbi:nucleotide pyrophosphohydrolase [Porphyromonas sp.]|uniref:nucleotide pyrophosphohydrolase n=1 Tax=Porphyromonas sp. TaxID=1924944 RepID=UPI0026DB2497|nr:nucleotide pyrophosphohydrolase [Porphyromonas sp.]MDO4770582.1 nucleotide pyrophosphohydrolase [Porphyromonas sp.]
MSTDQSNKATSPTLSEMQEAVDSWIKEYGVRYFSPLTNMAILTEEVGELARIMARMYGDQSTKKGEDISQDKLADELADILWVVGCIANQTGCDLSKAFERNIRKKTTRDKDRHLNNIKLTEQ